MLARRLIVCLDVAGGQVVKGTRFRRMRPLGTPATMAAEYEASGADEIVFLDISASAVGAAMLLDDVRRTAAAMTIPLTVGGGVRRLDDIALALRAGADKVAINSAAVSEPTLLSRAAARFGAQCVVCSIDARRDRSTWTVYTHGGRRATNLDAVQWAQQAAALGAGELLVTSIDRDGTRLGYDNALTYAIAATVPVPVIASGGAGEPAHLVEAFRSGRADAVLVAGIVHDGRYSVHDLKSYLAAAGIPTRVN
ncbi:MAG: imidazole glycerol phosphate synthase subunit HisF [Gemmatimonadaceae bacterium]